jgi:hypothetical protein
MIEMVPFRLAIVSSFLTFKNTTGFSSGLEVCAQPKGRLARKPAAKATATVIRLIHIDNLLTSSVGHLLPLRESFSFRGDRALSAARSSEPHEEGVNRPQN